MSRNEAGDEDIWPKQQQNNNNNKKTGRMQWTHVKITKQENKSLVFFFIRFFQWVTSNAVSILHFKCHTSVCTKLISHEKHANEWTNDRAIDRSHIKTTATKKCALTHTHCWLNTVSETSQIGRSATRASVMDVELAILAHHSHHLIINYISLKMTAMECWITSHCYIFVAVHSTQTRFKLWWPIPPPVWSRSFAHSRSLISLSTPRDAFFFLRFSVSWLVLFWSWRAELSEWC